MAVFFSYHHWPDYGYSDFNVKIDAAICANKVRSNSALLSFVHLKFNLLSMSLVKEKMKLLGPDRKLFDSVQLCLEFFAAASITSHYAAGK